VSAEIIRFMRRPNRRRAPTDFPTIAFRSAAAPDDLSMDHVDTAPYEYGAPVVMFDLVPSLQVSVASGEKDVDGSEEPGHDVTYG
jgi:hypothetical protein